MERTLKARFAVGIFAACDSLRRALADLVTLGYQQKDLILWSPAKKASGASDIRQVEESAQTPVWPLTGTGSSTRERPQPPAPVNLSIGFELVRDSQAWLAPDQYNALLEAIERDRKVLFVCMREDRQIAPTCSILLAHCTQQVNTHEVVIRH